MYYLNDKHYEYEYALYCRVGNACPYIREINYITDMDGVYRYIEEIEKKHNHYRQIFYIDNDFYKNNYSINMNGTYYKFLRRKVQDWEEFGVKQGRATNNNIFYISNYM